MGENIAATATGIDRVEQLAIESLPGKKWDVIIVGGGPAGSVAAIGLASRGYDVLLADREWFPRAKVCGDGLTPGAMRILRRLDLLEEVRKIGRVCKQMSIYSPSHVRIDVPGDYLTVRREILDQLLARKALDAGVTFVRGTVNRLSQKDGSIAEVGFSEGGSAHTARCCLLATGGRLSLAQRAGLDVGPAANGAAVRCYIRSSLPLDRLIVACERAILPGYAWIFPVGQGLFNVGCGRFMYGGREKHVNFKKVFKDFLEDFPIAGEMLAQGSMETPLKGAVLRSGWRRNGMLTRGPFLGVGEMIGTTSPYTGEGIGKAMQSAVLAADLVHRCLVNGEMAYLARFPVYLGRVAGLRYEGFARTRKWFLHSGVVDFLARRINRSPYLYDAFKAILLEKNDPAQVFSWRGVWRSFRR